jgi:SHS2 domain-containing protein
LGAVERIGIRKTGQGWSLEGVLLGDVLSDRYEIHADVKAVTYNDMRIEEGEGFALQVVVDM